MHDDFEKEVSQRMQEFSINPQPEIWQRVEAALPEKRSRRIALWWWLVPLVVGAGLGLLWLGNHRQVKLTTPIVQEEKSISKSTPQNNESESSINNTPADSAVAMKPATTESNAATSPRANTSTNTNFTNLSIQKDKVTLAKQKQQNGQNATIQNSSNASSKKQLQTGGKREVKNIYGNAFVANDKVKDDLVSQANIHHQEPILEKADSTYIETKAVVSQPKDTALAKNINTPLKDTADKNIITKKQKDEKNATKKVTWLADAAMGSSWLQGTNNLDKLAVANYDLVYASPGAGVGSGVGNGSFSAPFVKPSANFSFKFGVIRRQAVSKHFSWQIGLHYQWLSTKQHVGLPADSFSSSFARSSPVYRYRIGINNTYRNVIHQLQFAPSINYTINPTSHSPISLSTGFSAAYNVSSNLLLHDYKNRSYLRNNQAAAKMQYGAYVGVDFFFQKKVQLGIIYQYSFSNVSNADLGSDYRWRQLHLHVSLPISK